MQAQKIFGNRWTEIAKVVSGRTDNAVKNRFSTLCKKRAKHEALAKENGRAYVNANNKRLLVDDILRLPGTVDVASSLKKLRRAHIPNHTENFTCGNMLVKDFGVSKQQLRAPFAVLAQNDRNAENLLVSTNREVLINASGKTEGTFLGKDDPNVAALVQQAELLSSLAVKVNMDTTEQSLENAWKILQNFFGKSKEGDKFKCRIYDADMQLEDFRELMEELSSSKRGIRLHQRQPEMYSSPSSSEYSTGSTSLSHSASDHGEPSQPEICTMHEEIGPVAQSLLEEYDACVDLSKSKHITSVTLDEEYSSPSQVTPMFKSLASTIPSPQFSESERHFLLKTLGIESPAHHTVTNPLQSPPCRKALLQGL
ncbi:transcription factor MYB88-like isoform X2 [Silene latifolia]|uniref:transcription factor MYB88-like isoform X2 n=1 Tax=Silene latifolia TaxID=37657 RepID=UPI003D76B38B